MRLGDRPNIDDDIVEGYRVTHQTKYKNHGFVKIDQAGPLIEYDLEKNRIFWIFDFFFFRPIPAKGNRLEGGGKLALIPLISLKYQFGLWIILFIDQKYYGGLGGGAPSGKMGHVIRKYRRIYNTWIRLTLGFNN